MFAARVMEMACGESFEAAIYMLRAPWRSDTRLAAACGGCVMGMKRDRLPLCLSALLCSDTRLACFPGNKYEHDSASARRREVLRAISDATRGWPSAAARAGASSSWLELQTKIS